MEANKHYVIHGSLSLDEAVTKEEHDALSGRVDDLETGETDIETRVTNLEKQKIITGEIANIQVSSNSYKNVLFNFNHTFASPPKVFTQLETYPGATNPVDWDHVSAWVIVTTESNCMVRVFVNRGYDYNSLVLKWVAIGVDN